MNSSVLVKCCLMRRFLKMSSRWYYKIELVCRILGFVIKVQVETLQYDLVTGKINIFLCTSEWCSKMNEIPRTRTVQKFHGKMKCRAKFILIRRILKSIHFTISHGILFPWTPTGMNSKTFYMRENSSFNSTFYELSAVFTYSILCSVNVSLFLLKVVYFINYLFLFFFEKNAYLEV